MSDAVRAYLGLGANLGDRLANLVQAVQAMGEAGQRPFAGRAPVLTVDAVSPVYETAPVGSGGTGSGVEGQPAYLNCAVAVTTRLPVSELLWLTAGIEAALGRVRRERWGPRTVDIDILLYGSAQVHTPDLTVPHPRATERAFVLRPLLDLDPQLALPGGAPLVTYLAALPPQELRILLPAAKFAALVRRTGTPGQP